MKERLQKIIANAGITSRRHAESLIAEGRVSVNEKIAKIGDKADSAVDQITVDGEPIQPATTTIVVALNKPKGVITSLSDPQGRETVGDLLAKSEFNSIRLYPVGRLDQTAEGLLLLTNDGELTNTLTHPSGHIPKTYRIKLQEPLQNNQLQSLQSGSVELPNETRPAQIKHIKQINRFTLELTIEEGRNHIVKRIIATTGATVAKLTRIQIGAFALPSELTPGKFQQLTTDDIAKLTQSQAN